MVLNWGMGYLASPPTREVVAARPQSALVAAPIAPLPHLAHPNGTSGTNPLLGLEPTALAQTPCRKVAAISTTEGRGEKMDPCQLYPHKLMASKCTYMVYEEDIFVWWQGQV
jgi:hypothetical protein